MKFICYADWNELPERANLLFEEQARRSIFFSRPWFEGLPKEITEEGQTMLLACAVEGEDVLAILPLVTREGNHLYGLRHFYTALYSLLLVQHNQLQILECLAQGLDRMSIASLHLEPVADDDCNVHMLQQVMQSMGYECHRHFRFYNWICRLEGQSFSDYMAARPGRVRSTITRKQRKLAREHGYHVRLYTDSNLQQALQDYRTVYRSSWKPHEQFEDFIEVLARTLSGSGWLRLAVLYIDEKPAAAQFWSVAYGKASIFKLVYDEACKQYSPGSILIAYLMQHVIDIDKVKEIDFLTGNDVYKQDWMSQRRMRYTVSLYKPRKPTGFRQRVIDPIKTLFLTNRI